MDIQTKSILDPLKGQRSFRYAVAAAVGLSVAIAGTAQANDLIGGLLTPHPEEAIISSVGLIAYSPIVWLIEAAVLNAFLRRGYWRCLAYVAAANIVSTLLAMLWYVASALTPGKVFGPGEGWKTAWVYRQWDALGLLLVRSYLVTVAEETTVIGLVLRKARGVGIPFVPVAAANAVTYYLTALLIAVWMAVAPPAARP